jgi:hypothetical protein
MTVGATKMRDMFCHPDAEHGGKLIHTSLDTVPVDKFVKCFRFTIFLEWNNSRATLYPHARPIAADGDPVILWPLTLTTTGSCGKTLLM